jgi:hypothetical protein
MQKKKSKIFMPLKEYEENKEYLEELEAKVIAQLTNVYSANMVRNKMMLDKGFDEFVIDGTYDRFIEEFNKKHTEWNKK